MGSSGLKELLRSPRHFYYRHGLQIPPPETAAQRIGKLVHAAILEPERYQVHLKVMPKFDKRTNAGKAAYEDFMAARNAEDICVSQEDHDLVLNVIEQVYKHPVARGVLLGGEREWSGFFREPQTGLLGKIRPDLMVRDEGMILDVKTTTNASRSAFEKQIAQFRYDVQAAWYLHGAAQIDPNVEWRQYYLLAVEKTEPFVSSLFRMDNAALLCGEIAMRKALSRYLECTKSNHFPGYQEVAEYCSVPQWLLNETEMDLDQQQLEGEDAG